ncbi:MAG: alpha/beta hydrolase [Deltaproteobacteria bacterium]
MGMRWTDGKCEKTVIEIADGSLIHVESWGRGRPAIVLLHGWSMSSAFWVKQKAALSDAFTVIAVDLRAHGHSSKALQGHTVPQYARDVRAVLESLHITGATLAGWSMAGPVVLDYWRAYGDDRVSALALVEMTPFPLSPEPWNTHALKGHNMEGLNTAMISLQEDRVAYGRRFIGNMFHDGVGTPEDQEWMLKEYLKTPTAQAVAAYSDYVMRDYTGVLKDITVPVLVANGRSEYLCFGPKTGRYVADTLPKGRLVIYEGSGHMPFYETSEAFNKDLASLARP